MPVACHGGLTCTALSIHTQGMAVAQEERDAAVAQLASARAELAAVTRRAARAEAAADAARTEAERATAASAALVCACVPRLLSLLNRQQDNSDRDSLSYALHPL